MKNKQCDQLTSIVQIEQLFLPMYLLGEEYTEQYPMLELYIGQMEFGIRRIVKYHLCNVSEKRKL